MTSRHGGVPATDRLRVLSINRLDWGMIGALVAVVAVWFCLPHFLGTEAQARGPQCPLCRICGIRSSVIMVSAMTAAGALGGSWGRCSCRARATASSQFFSRGGLAFEGILVAIVARSRPLPCRSWLSFTGICARARSDEHPHRRAAEVIGVVTAIIILLVSSSFSLNFLTACSGADRPSGPWRHGECCQVTELFLTVFSAAFFVTIIRTTTPLLLATLGGLIADLSVRSMWRWKA